MKAAISRQTKDHFASNAKGFFRAYRLLLVLFFSALLADGISTVYFMLGEGIDETELHPVVSLAARMAGPVAGPIIGVFGKAIAGIIVAIYWRRIAWIILLAVTVLSTWAAWYNLWGWHYYEPAIYRWWPL